MPEKLKRIVLTGGPSGGKTTALAIVSETFGASVEVVKEAATLIYSGGFPRRDNSREHVFSAQRIIFFVTKELEALAERTANERAKLIVCDRGILDGAVYWPDGADDFFKQMNTTKEAELARYDLVIHVSPPGREELYHATNVRTEDLKTALEVDERVLKVWSGHPNRIVVDKNATYFEKAKIIKDIINDLIKKS